MLTVSIMSCHAQRLGFLSENPTFAERVEQAGLAWVGPSSSVIRQFGLKHTARRLAVDAGVSLVHLSRLWGYGE